MNTGAFQSERSAAVSPDGALIALERFGLVTIFDTTLDHVITLEIDARGLLFDPTGSRLFAVDPDADELVAFSTSNWHELSRWALGEDYPTYFFSTDFFGAMSATADGNMVFLTSRDGVRAISTTPPVVVSPCSARSLAYYANAPMDYDYAQQLTLPAGFGEGEFTLELWIKPDASFPVGPTSGGEMQRLNWSDADNAPYSSGSWWYDGNFLLDGHNNNAFANGTFSLQFYGGGRLRWLFGDGGNPGSGGVWSVGAYPASETPSLLDGDWHQITLVRRWAEPDGANLELWIDGLLIDTETTVGRTDMRTYWDDWTAFPDGQRGWFWGAEKQAAIGVLSQYEDFKGLVDATRFWSRARSAAEIERAFGECPSTQPSLVGRFELDEGNGLLSCDTLNGASCQQLSNMKPGYWSMDVAPMSAITDADSDGVSDTIDNCTEVANADQRDSNGDGYGNRCDADLNNDGVVDFLDLGLMKAVFFTFDPDADLVPGIGVGFADLAILKSYFFGPPGPSALAP